MYVDLAPRRFTSRPPTQDDDDGASTEPDDDVPASSPSSEYRPRSLAAVHGRNKQRAAANGSSTKASTTREAAQRVPAATASGTAGKLGPASAASIEKKRALLRDEFQRLVEKQRALEVAASNLRFRQRVFDIKEEASRELAAERKARAAFEQLEDHFTCSL